MPRRKRRPPSKGIHTHWVAPAQAAEVKLTPVMNEILVTLDHIARSSQMLSAVDMLIGAKTGAYPESSEMDRKLDEMLTRINSLSESVGQIQARAKADRVETKRRRAERNGAAGG